MSRPIRVCHVITRLIVGGAQENTLISAARADGRRFVSKVVSGPQTGPEGELHTWGRGLGVRIEVEPALVRELAPVRDALAFLRLWRRFRRERPDVVHTHSSKAGILGRAAARLARVPVVVHTIHGWSFHEHMPAWERRLYVGLERLCARWCDRLVVVAERDLSKGLREGIGVPERYVLIRSGIDLEPFSDPPRRSDREAVRREFGIDPGAPLVGTVSRLSPQKNPLGFCDVAARIAAKVPDAWFLFVGDGPLRREVEAEARRLGVADRLVITGIRDDVPRLLGGFDVFVLTSLWEGLPRVVPQAMAAGLPIVASGVDGVAEALVDGKTGLLVRPGDEEALEEAVVGLLVEPGRARRMGEQARESVRPFDARRMVAELESVYAELVTGASSRRGKR